MLIITLVKGTPITHGIRGFEAPQPGPVFEGPAFKGRTRRIIGKVRTGRLGPEAVTGTFTARGPASPDGPPIGPRVVVARTPMRSTPEAVGLGAAPRATPPFALGPPPATLRGQAKRTGCSARRLVLSASTEGRTAGRRASIGSRGGPTLRRTLRPRTPPRAFARCARSRTTPLAPLMANGPGARAGPVRWSGLRTSTRSATTYAVRLRTFSGRRRSAGTRIGHGRLRKI